ncbi:DinB family protein [Cytobacillus oceanisediminis]|uniref:DinB family protein n=1 Tax=Cytobacillus oceanisediminis TaxID=665099 RepID=UPI001FB56395|nr:DinB family protein [Cytobacillus oceanisediminis]
MKSTLPKKEKSNDHKRSLIKTTIRLLDQPNWFVPLSAAIEGLSAKEASFKSGTANSVWQIVTHLTFWNDRYLSRFKELPLAQTHIANDETFSINESVTEEDWQSAIKALQNVLFEWIKTLKECNEEKLLSSAYKEPIESWSSVISNLTIHNAYHIGQIVEIRKMYGLWDPKNGVH